MADISDIIVGEIEPEPAGLAGEEVEMSGHAEDKRDAGSPEDQSKQAAHEAKHAALAALKAADAAAIAKAELAKSKAVGAHAASILAAEQTRSQAAADKARFAQQLENAVQVSRHLQSVLNDAGIKAQAAVDHYSKLKITLDQAEADMKSAAAEVALKTDELQAAQKVEGDLRTKVLDLDSAHETFEMAKATAEVALATAKSDYAQEVARIKKAAADRDMASFSA